MHNRNTVNKQGAKMSKAAIARVLNVKAVKVEDKEMSLYGNDNKITKLPYKGMSLSTYGRARIVKAMKELDGYVEVPVKQSSDAKTQVNWGFKNEKTGDMLFIRSQRSMSYSGFRSNSYSRTNANIYFIAADSKKLIANWVAAEDQVKAIKQKRKETLAKNKELRTASNLKWVSELIYEESFKAHVTDLNTVPDLWMGFRGVVSKTTGLRDLNNILAKKSQRMFDTRLGRMGPYADELTEDLAKLWMDSTLAGLVKIAQACKLTAEVNGRIVKVTGKQGSINVNVGIGRFSRGKGTYMVVSQQ